VIQCPWSFRDKNVLVLSETLEEGAVQILVDVAISNIFPEQCKAWHAAAEDSHKSSREEIMKSQEKVCQVLNSQEGILRRALLDAVVDDVTKLFPCVFLRGSLNTACSGEISK